jgi:asparagine synthase (glutamine-hydrolysing)
MQGVRILLDGVDGDVVASQGGDYLAHLLRSGMWRIAVVEAIGASEFSRHSYSPWALLYSSGLSALKPYVPAPLLRLRRRLRGTDRLSTIAKESVINVDFARRINLRERLAALRRDHDTTLDKNLKEAHAAVLNSPYITVALERYERAASAYSVEPGHPFFDKRLVEFCLGLPWEQKVHRGWSKVSVRRAMAEIVPGEVCWRRGRGGLGRDFIRSLLTLEREFIENVVSNQLEDIGEYVDTGAVREAYHRYVSRGTFEAGAAVWEAVTLAVWLRGDQMTAQRDRTVEYSGRSASTSGR